MDDTVGGEITDLGLISFERLLSVLCTRLGGGEEKRVQCELYRVLWVYCEGCALRH